ncbi:DUF5134 domain-containing protein [Streptomyces sp. TX20-6-3]|uniref:DUF5134 domain-containing protein n=1 Tax=Streptomyces sp. TX20-6-3 TaxID=3028705 RepID=UPI0029A5FCC4|nr:DUF5134 domain-containing protein [Streptomyces sp. TX20-6-3]MDX2561373.1 DUF5134 domain-containing protein [Streptomyces sp. TX20-6-3]
MHGPVTAGWLLVALCAAVGTTACLLRWRGGAGKSPATVGDEALMGFGMAAMAVPALAFTPPPWVWTVYAVVFGGAALRALWSARGERRHLHHAVGSLAMVYMAVAMATSAGGAHGGHGPGGATLLTGLLLTYYAGYVLWAGGRLVGADLAAACRLSMGVGMFTMLMTM